ncbi:hypothetical protein LXL04_037936 [Taraxacum kok-saghyz]
MTSSDEELYLANSNFVSYAELLKSVRDFYFSKGYAISIRDSSKDNFVKLQCDQGGRKGIDGVWVLNAKNLTHNHEPSADMSGHPSFRRLSPTDVQSVKNMTLSGIAPRQILSSLRQGNQNLPANSRTIYNLEAKICKEKLDNRSRVSALFEELQKEEKEDEAIYIWALSVFKKTLENREPSVIMTNRELALMNAIKKAKKVALEYIKKTWLPWKEMFVSAWTDNYMHLGNHASSRAEGAHAKLKLYLQVSTGGFQGVKEKICLAITNEFNEIKVKLAYEKIHVLHICDVPVFKELLYNVSHFALHEIHMQFERIKNGTMTDCTGHFMATMGLPCAHKINHLYRKPLSLDLIHPHWKIDTLRLDSKDDSQNDVVNEFDGLLSELSTKYQTWPLSKKEIAISMITKLLNESDTFFEPMILRPKGRPPKANKKRGVNSTARDPSRF